VFEVEADLIRLHHPLLLASGAPSPIGSCAFLDHEGACRIYAERPYVCRTQGLPLRWIESGSPSELEEREYRDICTLNETSNGLETLEASECFTLGPAEERLARLQLARAIDVIEPVRGSQSGRVGLRSMFVQKSSFSNEWSIRSGPWSAIPVFRMDMCPRRADAQWNNSQWWWFMGDKSPKNKDKSKKRDTADKNQKKAQAASKASSQSRVPAKGK
jgi:uncharacterized protein